MSRCEGAGKPVLASMKHLTSATESRACCQHRAWCVGDTCTSRVYVLSARTKICMVASTDQSVLVVILNYLTRKSSHRKCVNILVKFVGLRRYVNLEGRTGWCLSGMTYRRWATRTPKIFAEISRLDKAEGNLSPQSQSCVVGSSEVCFLGEMFQSR